MINQKQIMIEWDKAGLPNNHYTYGDITSIFEDLSHSAENDLEANKMFILAIRKAAMANSTTSMAVQNIVRKWLLAGLTSAQAVGDYEKESQQMKQKGRYGQPVKQESKVSEPTSDEIKQQNERWAKELGYESVEAMAKGTHDILVNLRATRAERLANKPKTGLTAEGHQVVRRF